jgi:hypothetical protein
MGSLHDLTQVSNLKLWLGLSGSDDDEILEHLIVQTSRAILTYLDRPAVMPSLYTERLDGGCETSVVLRQWPVISVELCSLNGVAVSAAKQSGLSTEAGYIVDSVDSAPPGRMQRLSLQCGFFPRGVQNVSITYFAGYQVTNEVAIVPSVDPYAVRVLEPYGRFVANVGATDSVGVALRKVTDEPGPGQYRCDGGGYLFSSASAGKEVRLSYGFVPNDLERCCVEWVAEQYNYRSRIGQHTKSLGGNESISFIVKDIPDFVKTLLQPYRRVVCP